MKFVSIIVAVVIGLMIFNTAEEAYAGFRYKVRVEQCKSEFKAPEWADGFTDWACKQWAK